MKLLLICLSALAISPLSVAQVTPGENPVIAQYEQYVESAEGEKTGWPDVSRSGLLARAESAEAILQAVETSRTLDPTDKAILTRLLREDILNVEQDVARIPFNGDWGFQAEPVFSGLQTRIRTEEDAYNYIKRLQGLPAYFAENIRNMRRGMETGFTSHSDPLATTIEQVREQIVTNPVESDLYQPFKNLPADLPDNKRKAIEADGRAAVAGAIMAYRDTLRFLETEYKPFARSAPGLASLPGGKDMYAALLEHHTAGSGFTPEVVHALGVREVERIRGEMQAVLDELRFEGDIADFIAFLRTERDFYPETDAELMANARDLSDRLRAILPQYFNTLPQLGFDVAPVPDAIAPGYTSARYVQGDPEQGVKGRFLVNTYALNQRPLYELPALAAHEAVPGHHLQIALAQEMRDHPKFRQDYYATAFGEGWGLYAERIAGEAGLYETPYEQFGALSMEMWRACRLVADTGLHWYNWSRPAAEKCFRENTALSDLNIKTEVTRYIGWPGQATAYKVGELKISALRARAEDRLGDDFDIRSFHGAVLGEGAVPLDVLEANIADWTDKQLKVAP